MKKGFTLVELLIVIAIIAILAAVVFVALDPAKRFADARNATRWQETDSILNAVLKYQTDNDGDLPVGIDTNLRMIGMATSGCDIACGVSGASATSAFSDSDQTAFDSGVYNNTQWDSGNSWVELTAAGLASGSGTYASSVKDAGVDVSWNAFSWLPQQPYYKELPGAGASETGYPAGNANMSGNAFLMHLNEPSGSTSFSDSSGTGNNGSCAGTACPACGVPGKFYTACDFDGSGDVLTVANSASLNLGNNFSLEAWIWLDASPTAAGHDMYIIDRHTTSGSDRGYALLADTYYSVDRAAFYIGNSGTTRLRSNTVLATGRWYHIAATYDNATMRLYVDGNLDNSLSVAGGYAPFVSAMYIGAVSAFGSESFSGPVDETAIFSRTLSGPEILEHYRRGANRLRFQVRSCDDAACAGESFVGPDGTNTTYFSELGSALNTPPSISLSGLAENRYFQYQAFLDTNTSSYSPEINSVSAGNGGGEGGEPTAAACLNLNPELVDYYLTDIPEDPEEGTEDMTYYAIKRTPNGRINVKACAPEQGEDIYVQR